jgi:signal transduction histidine kinase
MSFPPAHLEDTGLEVIDILSDPAFLDRQLHTREVATRMAGVQRLTRAFVHSPDTILQELVNAAVDLCDADSAGISIEREDPTDEQFYHWLATAGAYSPFLYAMLPRYPSACGICLERGRPQLFRVTQRFFDILGVTAPLVTDGVLLPWQVDGTRGTIFVMSHKHPEAFDMGDVSMMQMLADFAAMGFRHQRQQKKLIAQERSAAAAAMANNLAHQINNPLQSLTNIVYLAAHGAVQQDSRVLGNQMGAHVDRLSNLVGKLLAVPDK